MVKSQQELGTSLKGVTKVLSRMNKQLNTSEIKEIMNEFMRENMKAEATQEMMGDAIDDAMEG